MWKWDVVLMMHLLMCCSYNQVDYRPGIYVMFTVEIQWSRITVELPLMATTGKRTTVNCEMFVFQIRVRQQPLIVYVHVTQ